MNVSNEVPAKLSEIVRTYDWVDRAGLAKPYIVCPRFVLQKIINPWSIFQSPFHVGDKPNEWEPLLFSVPYNLLEESKCLFLIELAIAEMRIGPSA